MGNNCDLRHILHTNVQKHACCTAEGGAASSMAMAKLVLDLEGRRERQGAQDDTLQAADHTVPS
jgi:hypothetical protein